MLLSAKYYWTIRAERGIYGMQRKEDGIMREGKKPMAVSEKYMLTIKEAAEYFNIGIKKMRRLAGDNEGEFAIYMGNRYLVIRERFEQYIVNLSRGGEGEEE